MVIDHRFSDGRTALETYLRGDPDDTFSEYWQALLTGPQAEALVSLNNLPVRIWGQVSGLNETGWPVIEVQRYEEVHPGLRFQAWLGVWEPVTLEGREVLLLTTLEGEQFVLSGSILMGAAAAIGIEGDRVVIEGLVEPGKTFGGYPVITEHGGSIANELNDLSSYQITGNEPGVWDETGSASVLAQELQGTGKVDSVELVYAASSLQRCGGIRDTDPQNAPWLIVQPVWRFSGSFLDQGDDRTFEIQVQALKEGYLAQP